jgi:hypothetical protein
MRARSAVRFVLDAFERGSGRCRSAASFKREIDPANAPEQSLYDRGHLRGVE